MSGLNWAIRAAGVFLLWAAAVALPAQTITTVHRFVGPDGASPNAALIQATDGKLYGTTFGGGANSSGNCTAYGFSACGTVFSIAPNGAVTTLYSFCAQTNCADGYLPAAPLIQGADGNFYGTTIGGGAFDNCVVGACGGTVFKITSSGTLTTLHSFSSGAQGYGPYAGLIQDAGGNLYGTTFEGGSNSRVCAGQNGCGTIFKITPEGALTTLHTFDFTDGSNPLAGLTQGADGNFYGTTNAGGANTNHCQGGCGTVFKITPDGVLTSLHSFDVTDGIQPGQLIQAADGDFYGTTFFGGAGTNVNCNDACGTVFSITSTGALTTLYSFDFTDGTGPQGALVEAAGGDFYGTTFQGGPDTNNLGTAYKITPQGVLTPIYDFVLGNKHGFEPTGTLLLSPNGNLYGTTTLGGMRTSQCDLSCGTAFGLSVGLKPFVEPQTASGKVGAAVNILGSNLTGATSVTFNGASAVFTVVSRSLITTTVPPGATTGKIQVVIPRGTLSSIVNFQVLP